jgi:hypothetical protein
MCTVRNDCYYVAGIGPKKLYAPVFYKDLSSVLHCAIRWLAYWVSSSVCLSLNHYSARKL